MYSMWYFNKLYFQNFLTTRNYSVETVNELWLRKAGYCWPGIPYKRASKIPKGHPSWRGHASGTLISYRWWDAFGTVINSQCEPTMWQNTLVVRELACTLPMKTEWSFSSSATVQEVVSWPYNVSETHLSWLEVLFNYHTVGLWVFINMMITAWNDLLV